MNRTNLPCGTSIQKITINQFIEYLGQKCNVDVLILGNRHGVMFLIIWISPLDSFQFDGSICVPGISHHLLRTFLGYTTTIFIIKCSSEYCRTLKMGNRIWSFLKLRDKNYSLLRLFWIFGGKFFQTHGMVISKSTQLPPFSPMLISNIRKRTLQANVPLFWTLSRDVAPLQYSKLWLDVIKSKQSLLLCNYLPFLAANTCTT